MTKIPFAPTLLCLACACASAPLQAQTDPAGPGVAFEPQRVLVSASAVGNLSARALLTSVDTVGGATLQDSAIGSNFELFARLPGMQLTPFHQGTTTGKPSMRGFNGEGEVNAVKLLIDGVPSNSNDGNMPYLDLVLPLGLQAITAVRGTNDARFGLHNIAGNLDLLTRQGGNATDARLGLGPWGRADLQLAVDRDAGGFSQNYSVGVRHADGWREHARADRRSLSGQWAYAPAGQDLRVSAALRLHQADAQEPGYLTQAEADARPRQMSAVSATDGGERFVGQANLGVEGGQRSRLSWRVLAYVNRFDDQRWVRFSASASQQERDTDETHRGARAIFSWRPAVAALPGLALEGGIDTERQRNASQRYSTAERVRVAQTRDQRWSFDIDGVFVQAVLQPLPTLRLVSGYRIDRVDGQFHDLRAGTTAGMTGYGSIRQPKLSAVWTPADGLSAYANWGRSFQVGVGAAGYKNSASSADAQASMNTGSELGLKFAWGPALDGRVAVWRQTATGEFYRQLNSNNGDSVNIGATRRQGLDVQLRARPAATLEAFATLALQEARITRPLPNAPATLGQEVDHVPRRLFNAGIDWQARPDWKLSAWLQGQGSYWLERTNALTGKYGAYSTLNLGASWAATPTLQVDAQLLNAANGRREYVWWDGAKTLHSPGDPRALHLAVRAAF
jgi:iron complex outermembrane receptor protein